MAMSKACQCQSRPCPQRKLARRRLPQDRASLREQYRSRHQHSRAQVAIARTRPIPSLLSAAACGEQASRRHFRMMPRLPWRHDYEEPAMKITTIALAGFFALGSSLALAQGMGGGGGAGGAGAG